GRPLLRADVHQPAVRSTRRGRGHVQVAVILVAVAGCLFEVHLDRPPGSNHWRWIDDTDAVALVGAHRADEPADQCQLRFRAERPGDACLAFAGGSRPPASVVIRIAPETVTVSPPVVR